jgi:phosphate transport system substrate-binding protein
MANLKGLCWTLAAFGLIGLFPPAASAQVLLTGSGSTFIFPIESKWANMYEKVEPGVKIGYTPNGSGAGIGQLLLRLTDFAGSDAPLTDKQITDAPGNVLHFPAALGADVVAYNLPEIGAARLKLTGSVIADIFRGKITKWNDPAIAGLNQDIKLPDKNILPIYRSDGSGTTFIFVDYLSKVSPEWEKEIGRGTTVKWPVGLSAPGNQGVMDALTHNPEAISYLELTYAVQAKLPYAQVQNAAGKWIDPDLKSITLTAENSMGSFRGDFRNSITNARGDGIYPISSYTYFLIYAKQTDPVKGEAIKSFLQWVLRDGQTYARQLEYAPLPESVITKAEAQLQQITTQSKRDCLIGTARNQRRCRSTLYFISSRMDFRKSGASFANSRFSIPA